ncbi:MAG: IS66 family insertion sequence element accessory protein TnpB [Clostridiales bacterium]|nr:IS66 family insertion sequence element accessory protein TnpB [Clostridiales bacterium]
MLNINRVTKVYLAVGVTDLRKSIDGLAAITKMVYKLNTYENAMFVFCNRKRDKIKILHWDNGFWLYYYRIEKGKLQWPGHNSETTAVTLEEFKWILKGYEARTVNKLKVDKAKNIY